MTRWLQRLASCISRKIAAISQDYSQVRAGHRVESVVQTTSRMALAYVLRAVAQALASLPFLHPTVADQTSAGLTLLSDELWLPPRQHGRRGYTSLDQ